MKVKTKISRLIEKLLEIMDRDGDVPVEFERLIIEGKIKDVREIGSGFIPGHEDDLVIWHYRRKGNKDEG